MTDIEFTRSFRSYMTASPAEDGSFWITRRYSQTAFRVLLDVEVLQSALDQITNIPQTWNQGGWFTALPAKFAGFSPAPECGTAGCLAGTIALQHGARPAGNPAAERLLYCVFTPEGGQMEVSLFAQRALLRELERELRVLHTGDYTHVMQNDWEDLLMGLWSAGNTLSDLWEFGQFLADGRLTVPEPEVLLAADEISQELYA